MTRRSTVPSVTADGTGALRWMERPSEPRVRITGHAPLQALDGVDWPGGAALFDVDDPGALQGWL